MSWSDQNEILRLGKKIVGGTGTNLPSEKSIISQIASSTGVAYNVARDAYVKSILDPLLQEKVRKSMKWLIHANFNPEFVNSEFQNVDLEDSMEPLDLIWVNPEGVQIPKRMFNIDSGNLEEFPSGQYVILSHSWKGEEISYPFISKVKESQKKREVYDMLQDDSDEEARRFAKFQSKKFKHLEAGKSDVELLSAQCTKDIRAQVKKIETVLARSSAGLRSGSNDSNARDLLARLAEFKNAIWDESFARDSFNAKRKELELRERADLALEKEKRDVGFDDSDISSEIDENGNISKGLAEAEKRLLQAEERLSRATAHCELMNHNPALRAAVEDLLPVLERKKSMDKIEGSIREAKRILDLGLFPSNGRKRYLWNDTCCINKGDANELTLALAMMGQWYNNADFCLVHLDTSSSTEWLSTWDNLENSPPLPNFHNFDDVRHPKWATRGWTLQELVLSKMTFYVNSRWQSLSRPAEGLGPYYYQCSYLDQHIRDRDICNVPIEAKSTLLDPIRLKELMDGKNKIDYICYPGCSEKSRRLIGILDFLGVHFPGDMDDDNCSAHIRNTISMATSNIESRLRGASPDAEKLKNLFTVLGFEMTSIRSQAKKLTKLVVRALTEECVGIVEQDKKQISQFANVPPSECCRGLSRSRHPAHDILLLASYRECTVPIDRVYSLMGVLGVKFAAFHAEGPTKALCRLLDEVVITTNDISIFNWAGKDLGSPIKGRSLYPSSLTAFSPEKTESYFTARRNDVLARASEEKRYGLQEISSRLTSLLRRTIDFVKGKSHKDVPVDLMRSILDVIQETSLKDLQPQLVNLGKLLVYLEDTPSFEKFKSATSFKSELKSTVDKDKKVDNSTNIASRFGIKTAQLPQISAPKLEIAGFQGYFGKKNTAKKPELAKELPIDSSTTQPQEAIVQQKSETETLVGEIHDWISTNRDVQRVPDEFKPVFDAISPPKFDLLVLERHKSKAKTTSFSESMICPNPIMVTTSGIEGVFDVQRVIITMENPDALRYQVQSAVNESQKISGQCTISTALSTITVNFSCTAGVLKKQLDVCDVVQRTLFEIDRQKIRSDTTQTKSTLAPEQGSTSYYNKLASLSTSFVPERFQGTESNASNDDKDSTPDTEPGVFGETEDQRRVCRMLEFVQETDINLIVGEWVLARFTGADGAKWFLCQLELGSTHSYYGRRIATDDIDFSTVLPEPGLVGHWENYMRNKKTELCRVMNVLIQGRMARRYADEMTNSTKENGKASEIQTDAEDDSEAEESLMDFVLRRGTLIGAEIVQNVTDRWGERMDGMLSNTVLQQVPKGLRTAIANLNENEDLLPAMFLSGVRVHMF